MVLFFTEWSSDCLWKFLSFHPEDGMATCFYVCFNAGVLIMCFFWTIQRMRNSLVWIYLLSLFGIGPRFQIWQQQGSQSLFIDSLGSHSFGVVHPNDDANLDPSVERNHSNQDTQKTFDNAEKGKDHPVGQPLCHVIVARVHGLEGHVSWVDETDQVDNELNSSNDRKQNAEEQNTGQEKDGLGVTCLGFHILEFFWTSSKQTRTRWERMCETWQESSVAVAPMRRLRGLDRSATNDSLKTLAQASMARTLLPDEQSFALIDDYRFCLVLPCPRFEYRSRDAEILWPRTSMSCHSPCMHILTILYSVLLTILSHRGVLGHKGIDLFDHLFDLRRKRHGGWWMDCMVWL